MEAMIMAIHISPLTTSAPSHRLDLHDFIPLSLPTSPGTHQCQGHTWGAREPRKNMNKRWTTGAMFGISGAKYEGNAGVKQFWMMKLHWLFLVIEFWKTYPSKRTTIKNDWNLTDSTKSKIIKGHIHIYSYLFDIYSPSLLIDNPDLSPWPIPMDSSRAPWGLKTFLATSS